MKIPARETGFSLIEVVVVVALLAICTAIALPRWTSLLPNYALNNSLRQVQSELHHIKMRAAAENVSFQFAYLQGAASYTIQRDATALATKPLADGTTITQQGAISFSPRGTASANRIRLRNLNGSCKQIVVSPTGRVRACTPMNCSADC